MRKKEKTVDIQLKTGLFEKSEGTYEYSLIMKKPQGASTSVLYSVKLDITRDGASVPEISESKNFLDMGQAIVYFDKLIIEKTTLSKLDRILKI